MDFTCDRCGGPVDPGNDVIRLDVALGRDPLILLIGRPRHILPVVRDGKTVCPGSPSRAQYIEGQPRDPRAQYAYDEKAEPFVRAAFAAIQQKEEVTPVL